MNKGNGKTWLQTAVYALSVLACIGAVFISWGKINADVDNLQRQITQNKTDSEAQRTEIAGNQKELQAQLHELDKKIVQILTLMQKQPTRTGGGP